MKDKLIIYTIDKMPMVFGGLTISHNSFIIMGGSFLRIKEWGDLHSTWAPSCFALPMTMKWWKNELTWCEWSSILNEIACNLNLFNWIPILKFDSNSIKLNSWNPKRKMICKLMKKVLKIYSSFPSFITMLLKKNF